MVPSSSGPLLSLHSLRKFVIKNHITLIIGISVCIVAAASIYKLFIKKPTYIYVKVKVGQGTWWANTARPNLWFMRAIREANEEKDFLGKPIAKVLKVSYYPYWGSSQFDIYVTMRLDVSKAGTTEKYSFKRETIGVGSPIDLEFNNVQFSGTITELSDKPLSDKLVYKTVYIYKRAPAPWEYDQIKVGDYFNDGNGDVIKVLDKGKGDASDDTNKMYFDQFDRLVKTESETYRYVFVKIGVRVRQEGGNLIYGEDTIISPGRALGFVTNEFTFVDYVVSRTE